MNLLYCTQKLLKDIGQIPQELEEPPFNSQLGNWYANLLRISRKKIILFTNEKTLFSFLGEGTKSSSLMVKTLLLAGMRSYLLAEGIKDSLVESLLLEYQELGFAKTNNRRILGSMNDIASLFDYSIASRGGFDYCNLVEITKNINQAPMKFLKYRCASDCIHEIFDASMGLPKYGRICE